MKLDRTKIKILKQSNQNDYFVKGSFQDRLSCVWDLTLQIWSITNKSNAEYRLQRHVTMLTRQ